MSCLALEVCEAAEVLSNSLDSTRHKKSGGIISLRVPIRAVDSLSWLATQANPTKSYWRRRGGGFSSAGLGAAKIFRGELGQLNRSFKDIFGLLIESENWVKFFGGMRFGPSLAHDDHWSNFAGFRLVVPAIEVRREKAASWLCCHLSSTDDIPAVKEQLFNLVDPSDAPSHKELPRLLETKEIPDFEKWQHDVSDILRGVIRGDAEKVVLARKKTLLFNNRIDPWSLLAKARSTAPQCYSFAFQNHEQDAYIGISPEQIFARHRSQLFTESLAGTRPRGENTKADQLLAKELLMSQKDRREHRCVSEFLVDRAMELCSSFIPTRQYQVLKLAKVQHLYSRFRGTLLPGTSDADILSLLHPTPAMCGFPRQKAKSYIEKCEIFDRGCFTGPVGYIGKHSTEFAAGIRVALTQKNLVHLFAGAGIVRDSCAHEEWDETDNKMRAYTDLFA